MTNYGVLLYDNGKPAQIWEVIEKWTLPISGDAMVTLRAGNIVVIEYQDEFWELV